MDDGHRAPVTGIIQNIIFIRLNCFFFLNIFLKNMKICFRYFLFSFSFHSSLTCSSPPFSIKLKNTKMKSFYSVFVIVIRFGTIFYAFGHDF